jgi:signal transduction histidine kinase
MYQTSPSGIQAVGDLAFGTHFCQFYRTRQDLIETLVPFFESGLRHGEACMWVTSTPLTAEDAWEAMRAAMPDFEDFVTRGQIEICDYEDWYLTSAGTPAEVLQGWLDRERRALEQGFMGLRLTGNTFWLERSGWNEFMAYEAAVNQAFGLFRIIALCTYSLDRCCAEDVLDVCRNHQFALTRRAGEWELIESSPLKIAKDELRRLNEDLEKMVQDRTSELQGALRARDEFMAMLAHELRNPLAPIRNAAQVLKLLTPPDAHLSWARDVIDRQVLQLSRLVDDLLDVSRVTRGRVELQKQEVELAAVLAQAVEISRPLIDQRQHTLHLALPPKPVHLEADPTRLSQVMSNLLNNAAKYMEPGGRISLSAEVHGSEVLLRVRDEGIGIPADMLSRIFDPFIQVERSLDRSEGGLGIGLALVRSLVEMHDGKVEAFSEGPGLGSEFVVRLPVLRVGETLEAPVRSEPKMGPSTVGRKILVVDDNQDAAESLEMLLELAGHEVQLAHDGEQALAVFESDRPEVVLLDIGLPKLDGFEVARRLRSNEKNRDILLVALTGYGKEGDRALSREAGFDHHLVKPVEPTTLMTLLARP